MKRTAFAKAAASSLILAVTMVGCAGSAFRPSAAAPQQSRNGHVAATEKALAKRDGAMAVKAAEAAVAADPRNPAYRQLLGRAYVASGRFASAETALSDAMSLGNQDARTIVSLALVKAALGKSEAARDLLAANADIVPAGDYGLAMAMAGDANEGVRILSAAIHDPSATAQTRQNLAYAYALAGRWKDARVIAGFDLEPTAANQRISQWAQSAAPMFATQRIALFMGVNVDSTDAGQPVALALAPDQAPATSAPVEMAANEAAVPAQHIAAVEAAAEDAPAIDHTLPDVAATPVAAPYAAPKPASRVTAAAMRPLRPKVRAAVPVSNWVVQLGAYDNAAIAKEKWFALARRNSALAERPVLTSQITLNGATFSRLAVSGFGDRAEAAALCRSIRVQRGQCFVRETAPGATVQRWALSAKARQFASR
ncbi:SPOR domain-containing protein [Sphingobium vermicomposti]|uniref:Flp pilus assembly protein TadD n=1 Tax=Sphingobium vermicomposti TaxID=529005 RepID=A0A846MH41_9SPHN|nr:SPOR domain-containing protein [Sphingobium vermicomposti]NIJ16666.1 Flp pilus assembly protein TadD [Sphingobium vermicomposti]